MIFGCLELRSSIDVATVSGTDDLDQQAVVEHLVSDAVVAGARAVGMLLAGHGDTAGWSRVVAEEIDRCPNSLLLLAGSADIDLAARRAISTR